MDIINMIFLKFNKILNGLLVRLNLCFADFVFLFVLLSSYVLFIISRIGRYALSFDESFSAYLLNYNFFDIAKLTALDIHPPLYYWVLKIWTGVFGLSEFSIRSMSLFFACLALVSIYCLVSRYYGVFAAKLAVIFTAISPLFVWYSQEARMYMLLGFIAIISTYLISFASDVRSNKRLWIFYGIVSGLGLLTQYMYVLVVVSQLFWRYIDLRYISKKGPFFSKDLAKSFWYMFLVNSIWLPFMISQYIIVKLNGFWLGSATLGNLIDVFSGPILFIENDSLSSYGFCIFILFVACLIILIRQAAPSLIKMMKYNALIWCLAFIPILLLIALSIPPLNSVLMIRYIFVSYIFIAIFLGIVVSVTWRSNLVIFLMCIFVFLTLITSTVYMDASLMVRSTGSKTSNSRDMIAEINNNSELCKSNNVIVDDYNSYYELIFYSKLKNNMYFLSNDIDAHYGSFNPLKNNKYNLQSVDDLNTACFWYIKPIYDTNYVDVNIPDIDRWHGEYRIKKNNGTNHGFEAVLYKFTGDK